MIILNGATALNEKLLDMLWPPAPSTPPNYPIVCADGGANLLYDSTQSSGQTGNERERVPTDIVGDLDSVHISVLEYYGAKGVRITKDLSENSNDFQKALVVAKSRRLIPDLPTIVVGGNGGRMDQTLGNLNTMYIEAEANHDIYWLDDRNVILTLSPNDHSIAVDPSREGPTCGLIPVGRPVEEVVTEGLRWNLDGRTLAFGGEGLVSTSNQIVEPIVKIKTSHPLLWTVELKLLLK